jgi:hypothetical protein
MINGTTCGHGKGEMMWIALEINNCIRGKQMLKTEKREVSIGKRCHM